MGAVKVEVGEVASVHGGETTRRTIVSTERDVIELLDGGNQAFPRMLAAIESARARIWLEIYTFSRHGIGAKFVDALSSASRRGVDVHVIIDGWGSAIDGRGIAHSLSAAGGQVKIYNPLRALLLGRLRRDHRKLLVVDDEIAFVGGINLDDRYAGKGERRGWADLAVEVRGPSARALAHRLRGEHVPYPATGNRILLSDWGGGGRLRKRYLQTLRRAKRSITLAHAYFLPDIRLRRALSVAARRGVRVSALLAGKTDVWLARVATRRLYSSLIRSGVDVRELTETVLHAKVVVVDSSHVLIGSFNLDPLSLANMEVLVESSDPLLANQAEAWIETHFSKATKISSAPAGWRRRWTDFLGSVADWLARRLEAWIRRD